MSYLRVTVAEWDIDVDSSEARALIQRIASEGLQVFRSQPGFIDYRLMRASARTTVAVAEWESEELGKRGAQRYRDWMGSSGIMQHLTLHTQDGDLVVNSRAG
jgi:hypothetical protein